MGQDEIYLQVIATSGDKGEKKNAEKVLRLLNVITNETLPIVLDRSLGGGWPAVLSSTILIGR
jgi:metal transporter CNNM